MSFPRTCLAAAGLTLASALAAAPALAGAIYQTYEFSGSISGATGWDPTYAPSSISFTFSGSVGVDPGTEGWYVAEVASFSGITIGTTEFDIDDIMISVQVDDTYTLLRVQGVIYGEGADVTTVGTDDFTLDFYNPSSPLSASPESLVLPLGWVNVTNAGAVGMGYAGSQSEFGTATMAQASTVPLPAAAPLLAAGLAGLGLFGARRRRG